VPRLDTASEDSIDGPVGAAKHKSQTTSMTKQSSSPSRDKLKFPWARAELLVEEIFDCMSRHCHVREDRTSSLEPSRTWKDEFVTDHTLRPERRRRPKRLPHFKVSTDSRRGEQKGALDPAAAAESI